MRNVIRNSGHLHTITIFGKSLGLYYIYMISELKIIINTGGRSYGSIYKKEVGRKK